MLEPDVTMTDYLIAAICALFVYLLQTSATSQRFLRIWFVVFFAAAGLAPFLAGTLHGFFPNPESSGYQALYVTVMVTTGVTALAAWILGAAILFDDRVVRIVTVIAFIEFLAYCVFALFISRSFLVVIVNYLPSALFALGVFGWVALRYSGLAPRLGVVGVVLIFVGAAVQQAKIGLHPEYFTYNAVYHVIQAVALTLIFVFARWLVLNSSFRPLLARNHAHRDAAGP